MAGHPIDPTYLSRAHPMMPSDGRLLVEVAKASLSLMSYMQEFRSAYEAGFLDCHDWTAIWARRIEAIHQRLERSAPTGGALPTMHQVQIGVLRTETAAGVSGGEHVALLVSLPRCWLLIDHTHNQFDLPMADYRERDVVRNKYSSIWRAMKTHIVQETYQEHVMMQWVKFLQSKPKIRKVEMRDLEYFPGNHDFRSGESIASAMKRERG